MTSSDDETGRDRHRHRSSEPLLARFRRRHANEVDVDELDPEDVARLIERTTKNDRAEPLTGGSVTSRPESDDDTAELQQVREELTEQSRVLQQLQQENAALRHTAEDYAAQLQKVQEALRQAEQRSQTLANETAARATEHSARVRELVAEREAAEVRARILQEQLDAAAIAPDDAQLRRAAQEHEALEKALAQAVRLADEAQTARANAEAAAASYAARLEQAESRTTPGDEETAALQARLDAAEERIRALQADADERNALHAERIDALLAELKAAEQAADEARRAGPVAEPEPELQHEPEPEPAPAPVAAGRTNAPSRYDSKRGAGLIAPLAGLVAMACAAVVGWMAYQGTLLDRLNISIGLTIVVVLAMFLALRRRAQTSEVHLDGGTLRLRFGDQHHTFYLNSPSTQVIMTGEPGDRDWSVQVLRRGRPPVTIDEKDVDPEAFTATLRHYRPSV